MNAVTEYRPTALAVEDFQKLDALALQSLSFRERQIREVYREKDEYGEMVEKVRYVEAGPEIFRKGEIIPRLAESLQRPASFRHIGSHLTRLAAHKPWGRGPEAFTVIIEDLCRDLESVSEYAIMKTCEKFRRDEKIIFFQDTAVFLKYAKDLDFALRQLTTMKPAETLQVAKPEPHAYTTKKKIQVNRMCKLAMKPRANWTKWEVRFFDGAKKERFVPKHQPPAHNFGYGDQP